MKLCFTFALILDLLFRCIGGVEDSDFSNPDYDFSTNKFPPSEIIFPTNVTLEDKDNPKAATPVFGEVSESDRVDEDDIRDGSFEESEDSNACGSPPVIDRARISGRSSPPYFIGASLSYSCEFGYSADRATHTSTCTKSSTDSKPAWTDPQILCSPRACGDPGFVANAERIGSQFTFPNSVSFECDDGYQLSGTNIRYCQVNGMWSATLPSCEKITCGTPEKPENGEVFYSSLNYGSSLRYTCDQGFILKNYHSRICSENGTWSGIEPFCAEAKCDDPVAPEHGFVEMAGGNPRIDSIAVFSCERGRRLIGSSISKCLDIGEWTFPTPKCLEPCSVPNVQFGTIGKYISKWNRQKQFTILTEGTEIQNGEELILRCNANYEPLGKKKAEVKIFCEKSEWKEIPVCIPAKCRTDPPPTENARIARVDKEHGGAVVYHCHKDFRKDKYGNVTCHFGVWRGKTPVCADRRCYVDKMGFPGLRKDHKNVYFNKEVFKPSCVDGYEVSNPENTFECGEGVWKGPFPPCTVASCSEPPPRIVHGHIKSYTGLHSSFVQYECEDSYLLMSSTVQCLFGKWEGNPPTCKDTRCYFQDLKLKEGMLLPSKDPTENGKALDVQCASGYHKLNIQPFCSRGEWTEHGISACEENRCSVPMIQNGALTQRSYRTILTWRGRVPEYRYETLRVGSQIQAGGSRYVSCIGGFTFQGRNMNYVGTTCTKGKWKPTPVCLFPGNVYKEESDDVTLAPRNSNAVKVEDSIDHTTSTTVFDEVKTTEPLSETSEAIEDCFCVYTGSENLVAFADNQRLVAGSKVRNSSVVKIHCKHIGYDRLIGNRELVCEQCRSWDISEYPQCNPPSHGDAIVHFGENLSILPGGVLTVDQGHDVLFICSGVGVERYPTWKYPSRSENITKRWVYDASTEYNYYYTKLEIHNTSPNHNGEYSCSLDGNRKTDLQLQVKVRCKTFEESDDFTVHYDNGQNVNSSVLFTCRDRKKKIEGSSVLTCLKNGQWSGQAPKCISLGCEGLEATENVEIIYSDGFKTGSRATFHCHRPYRRKGVSYLNCLPNGEWSGNVPTCTPPTCSLDELYDILPETVTADLKEETDNTLPYEFEVDLTCDGNMRLSAPATAQCGIDGKWKVPATKCVSGCLPVQILPESQMIIEPKKDFYRFGEYVELSCAPGQILSNEVEVLMCLSTGWSEIEIPSCKDSEPEAT